MTERKRMSTSWPSSALAYDGKINLDLNLQNVEDPVRVTLTPMQAMELGLQLINRSKECLQTIIHG
jgi:hypothetical protein